MSKLVEISVVVEVDDNQFDNGVLDINVIEEGELQLKNSNGEVISLSIFDMSILESA